MRADEQSCVVLLVASTEKPRRAATGGGLAVQEVRATDKVAHLANGLYVAQDSIAQHKIVNSFKT